MRTWDADTDIDAGTPTDATPPAVRARRDSRTRRAVPDGGTDREPELYDSLDGQVALVTGANRGLGREIASRLADLGATIYAATRSQSHDVPDDWRHVLVDVTQEGDIEHAVAGIEADAGRLDVLVNNAGVLHRGDDLVDEPTVQIDRTLSTNLRGPIVCCKHALPLLLDGEGGRIVNLSSSLGQFSGGQSGGTPAYRVSKTGLNGLTAYLHGEYADRGLLANSVSPGWVATDMGRQDDRNPPRSVAEGAETPVWLCRFRPGSPAGRFWKDRRPIDW